MQNEKTVAAIQEKLRYADHTIALEMIYQDPAVPLIP